MGHLAIHERELIPYSAEFERIFSTPWRDWENDPRMAVLAERFTQMYKTPQGTQTLWLAQANVLRDAIEIGGAVSAQKVSEGKTLPCFLLPVVLNAARPLHLVPGRLLEETERKFDLLAQNWRRHPDYPIKSYSWITNKKNAEYLFERKPDVIVCDEARVLARRDNVMCSRLERYLKQFPCRVFFFSGTMFTECSLEEIHHLLRWALGPTRMPLPASSDENRYWALALDDGIPEDQRVELGPMSQFAPSREAAKSMLGGMFKACPGITITSSVSVEASLFVETWSDVQVPSAVSKVMHDAWNGMRPDGREIAGLDRPKLCREAAQGFWYDWDPLPPEEYFTRRKAWKNVEYAILQGRPDMDNAGSLAKEAVRSGKVGGLRILEEWEEAERLHPVSLVTRWIDPFLVNAVLRKTQDFEGRPVLIWVAHRAFGFALAQAGNLSFYHNRGCDQHGRHIREEPGQTIVVSTNAMREGYELQDLYSDNLIISPQPSSEINEQMLGRTHRVRQKRSVYAVYLTHTHQAKEALERARANAYESQLLSGPQRLCVAEWIMERNRTGVRG